MCSPTDMNKDPAAPPVAQSRMEVKSNFEHEFANILTPVVGISELLLLRAGEVGDPDMIRLAGTLRDSATAARDLVQRCGEIHALECGRRALAWRTGNLVQLLKSTVRSVADTLAAEDVRIESFYGVDDAQVRMDFDLLPGVFHAIIKNAVEYVASEPVLDERIVHVSLMMEGGDHIVRISNPGTPIPTDRIDSFFDKFNSDRRRKPSGTGLGTTYARLVTHMHNGRISVQSNDERGTVVTISIPKAGDPKIDHQN